MVSVLRIDRLEPSADVLPVLHSKVVVRVVCASSVLNVFDVNCCVCAVILRIVIYYCGGNIIVYNNLN